MTIYAYTDGASRGNPGESGIGIILRNEMGKVIFSGCGYIGQVTNNIAEYQALIACLKKASSLKCKKLILHSDSELLVRQLRGKYRVRDKNLLKYFRQVNRLLKQAPYMFEIVHVDREKNFDADVLANKGIERREKLNL